MAEDAVSQFLMASIADGCEGLMVKRLEGESSAYQPNKRSDSWLKVRGWLKATDGSFVIWREAHSAVAGSQ